MGKKDRNSVVDLNRYDYKRVKIRGADGKMRHSMINGDAIAKAMLLHFSGGGTVAAVIRDNGLRAKYKDHGSTNPGLLRMMVGNSLRAMVKKGEKVTIGSFVIKSIKQAIDLPKIDKQVKPVKKRRNRRPVFVAQPQQVEAA